MSEWHSLGGEQIATTVVVPKGFDFQDITIGERAQIISAEGQTLHAPGEGAVIRLVARRTEENKNV